MLNRHTGFHVNMQEQLSLYVFVAVLFIVGVTFGAVMVNALSLEQREELTRYLSSFFGSINHGNLDGGSFLSLFSMQVKWFVLIWLLGLSVVGLPILFALDFLKGVLVGFTVGYMVGQYSWKGMLLALTAVVPQNLVIIPSMVTASVMAMAFSIYLVKNRFFPGNGSLTKPFFRYTLTLAGLIVLMAGVSLYEANISPHVMGWVTPMLAA